MIRPFGPEPKRFQTEVVARCIATILGTNEANLGELGSNHIGASIARRIVHNAHAKCKAATAVIDRGQTVA